MVQLVGEPRVGEASQNWVRRKWPEGWFRQQVSGLDGGVEGQEREGLLQVDAGEKGGGFVREVRPRALMRREGSCIVKENARGRLLMGGVVVR